MSGLGQAYLNKTLGAVFFGGAASAVLFGLTVVQSYIYLKDAKHDLLVQRIAVIIVMFLNATHLALTVHALFYYLIANYGNPFALLSPIWSLICLVIVTTTIYAIITALYCWRIWIVSDRKWYLIAPPVIFGLASIAISYTIAVKTFELKTFARVHAISWMLYVAYGSAVACDICIVAVLCYYLQKKRSSFVEMENIIGTLLLFCIATGAIACILHICNLLIYAIMSGNFVYIGIYEVTPGFYTNALLGTLNARDSLRSNLKKSKVLQLESDVTLALSQHVHSQSTCP